MRISFEADEANGYSDDSAITQGVRGRGADGTEHYLLFGISQDDEGDAGDEELARIHLEYDSQAYSGYGCIAKCVLERDCLRVDLLRQLGILQNVTGFDIRLRLDDASLLRLREALEQVFSRESALLSVPW